MATVVFEGVRKVFGRGTEVLSRLDFEIAHGEFVTLVGPSGSGKSTILNLIAGFEQPTSGRISIDAEDMAGRAPSERGVAMVFQSYALYPHMSVRRNIGFSLEVAGMDKRTIDSRVEETAARLELTGLLDRKPKDLSGGQRQRVALGRAIVRRPKLCLFDEPLSNLDAALRSQMRAEIKKLHADVGATFIYVTHDQTEAMTLSDRMMLLDKGVVQQFASPREVHERPANRFVARFVGSPPMNLVEPSTLGLSSEELPTRASLMVGVRPADIAIVTTANGALSGTVYLVEPTGDETWVTVSVGNDRVVARASNRDTLRVGDRVEIRVDRSRLHVFDASSGQRIER